MNSVYSIWKPTNISSYDVIRMIKKKFKNKTKVGHAGTLDPFAEGVLIVCTGNLVKQTSEFTNLNKTYYAEMTLGKQTDTFDLTGKTINKSLFDISTKNIKDCFSSIENEYFQSPPYFAAKKINGLKLYKLARKDIFIRKKPKRTNIYKLELIHFSDYKIIFNVICEAGTYIRALANDIGIMLKTHAYLSTLIRTDIGPFNNSNSLNIENIKHAYRT